MDQSIVHTPNVPILGDQSFPRLLVRVESNQVTIKVAKDQAELDGLGTEWKRTYVVNGGVTYAVDTDYPKMVYTQDGSTIRSQIVNNKDEQEKLGQQWHDTPAQFGHIGAPSFAEAQALARKGAVAPKPGVLGQNPVPRLNPDGSPNPAYGNPNATPQPPVARQPATTPVSPEFPPHA